MPSTSATSIGKRMHASANATEDESIRLARLRAMHMLDTAPEEIFDSIARAAAELCELPVATISLLDEHRQWFKAAIGMGDIRETPRDTAMSRYVVNSGEIMMVPDMAADPRFAANPMVTGPLRMRFYAAAPITLSDGITVGALCVLGRQPMVLADHQARTLCHLALTAARALETREEAARLLALADHSNARITALYRSTPIPIFSMDGEGRLMIVSDAWTTETGYTREELEGHHVTDFLTPASRTFALEVGIPRFVKVGRTDRHEYQIVCKDGTLIDVLVSQVLERDAGGNPLRSMGVAENITARRVAERELRAEQARMARVLELLQVTLESIADAVITTGIDGCVQWLNRVAERMTGRVKADAVGQPIDKVFVVIDGYTRMATRSPVTRCLARCEVVAGSEDTTLLSRNGEEFGITHSASPIRAADGQVLGAVLVFRDVSEQRRMHHEMSHRARHDPLTGLINRTEFEARLRHLLERDDADQAQHALLYVDLDRFKLVNDACGHAAGDQLLRQASDLLRGCVRDHDTVARIGGDEFGLILEHCNASRAQRVAQKICDHMEDFRFSFDGRRFRIGTSIGLVSIDRRWNTVKDLLQAADASCYAAKEGGRNRVHAWLDTDTVVKARHGDMQWVGRLEVALDEDGFELFGQRIETIGDDPNGLHFEVLLRLRENNGTVITPGAFLPAAERFHLATRIDRWVVRHAFDAMRRATAEGIAVSMMSINLSGQSLGDRAFLADISEMIRSATFDVACLCFEITETAAITHLSDALAFIDDVRPLGVKIALDDFGAGASSFGYLKSLPVDFLKIDGHFITNLLEDALDHAAVRCFCEVARAIGVRTIAEFVERDEVRRELLAIGVDMAQGYLIHRPEPLARLLHGTQHVAHGACPVEVT